MEGFESVMSIASIAKTRGVNMLGFGFMGPGIWFDRFGLGAEILGGPFCSLTGNHKAQTLKQVSICKLC